VDPGPWLLANIVVEPEQRVGLGRRVGIELLRPGAGPLNLRCTLDAFGRLPAGEWSQPALVDRGSAYELLPLPPPGRYPTRRRAGLAVYDELPEDQRALHLYETVAATDGEAGQLRGVVADLHAVVVTHLLVKVNRMWSNKVVAVPVPAVAMFSKDRAVREDIILSFTKKELLALPAAPGH